MWFRSEYHNTFLRIVCLYMVYLGLGFFSGSCKIVVTWGYFKNNPKLTAFLFSNTYLYQTFTECVSNQYIRFDVLILLITSSGESIDFIALLKRFHTDLTTIHVWSIVFNKLSQIEYLISVHILVCQHVKWLQVTESSLI